MSWGPDVWTAGSHQQELAHPGEKIEHKRDGRILHDYLDRVFDQALANPRPYADGGDVWDYLTELRVEGEALTRHEMQGIANVLLAGGRDTVIKLTTGLVWHLMANPSDREFLSENPQWFNRTVAEMVRYLTPLPKMERVLAEDRVGSDTERDTDKYVLLSFVSANYDKSIWPDPERIDIHRERKPHLAFGFGRHSCMGMNITEHEAGAFLDVLLTEWPNWKFDGEPEIEWGEAQGAAGETIRFIDRFAALRVKVS